MFGRRRILEAMQVADGVAGRPSGGDVRAEAARFDALSAAVRTALRTDDATVPSFDAMWAGVERRIAADKAPPRPVRAPLGVWQHLLGRRPILVLAPAGAAVVAAVLSWFLVLRPAEPSNLCFVDSYEVDEGSVLIDQDYDDPSRPTVIWQLEEG